MSEPKTWEITSPEDVDVFERETAEAHEAEERHGYTERPGACGVVLYIRNDLPPLFESSREDFLEHARETARDWHAAGGDPNGTRNLEDEHDRLYAAGELPVLGRRPPGYTGWASGSDNGGSSCHHDAAMLNAPTHDVQRIPLLVRQLHLPGLHPRQPCLVHLQRLHHRTYPGVLHHLVEHLQDGYLPVYLGRHPTYPQTPFETPEGAILGRNSKSPRF